MFLAFWSFASDANIIWNFFLRRKTVLKKQTYWTFHSYYYYFMDKRIIINLTTKPEINLCE